MGYTTGIERLMETNHNKNLIQRQIEYTDNQIDKLVYDLYDLNDEKIKIVEEVS